MVLDNWQVTKAGYEYFLDIAGWLGSTFMGLMLAFCLCHATVCFFQRKGINMEGYQRELGCAAARTGKAGAHQQGKPIAGICLSVAFLIIFLVVPQIICVDL